ncbi:MAG TPA: YqgE/AlgH family protein [Cytophagaceae bacterium]|jgi:putative transcriptional regulator|nr:YqgE/AlgH family protein [Cytophagaceae bacterium]
MLNIGDILISEPYLGDDNFERSVVLLGSHNEDGSLGFVMNKKSNMLLSDVVEELGEFDAPLYVGGPVEQDTLHFIYQEQLSLKGTIQIMENLFWGGDFEQLKSILREGKIEEKKIRFFLGYSGWSRGQLEKEMAEKVWIIHRLSAAGLFELDTEEMWRGILKNMGGQYKVLSNYPIDPRLN